MRDVYIYIIIMSMFFNTIAYIVLADDESIPTSPTNLVLSITSDRNEAKIGQPINISFNVTNIGTGKATNINIVTQLSKIIARPEEKLTIKDISTEDKDNSGHSISCQFGEKRNDDEVTIDKYGNIRIHLIYLDKTFYKVINYNTSISILEDNITLTPYTICNPIKDFDNFSWERKGTYIWHKPSIGAINIIKTNVSEELIFEIDPYYNITNCNITNCSKGIFTVFNGTKLTFDEDRITDDIHPVEGDEQNLSCNKEYIIKVIGDHCFSAEKEDLYTFIQKKNSSVIHVIDIIDTHKKFVTDPWNHPWNRQIVIVIAAVFLPLLIMLVLQKGIKCKNKTCLVILGIIVIGLYLGYIIYYLTTNTYYKPIIQVEAISISAAFFILSYYYCSEKNPNWKKFLFQAVSLLGFSIFFHYYMPEILLNKNIFVFFAGLGLVVIYAIRFKKQGKILKDGKNSLLPYLATITVLLYFIVPAIFLFKGAGVPFSSKFDLAELIIIIFAELMPLVAIVFTGISNEAAKKTIEFISKIIETKSES